ncbi:unnamed protein product [Cochlearia groenlandica]
MSESQRASAPDPFELFLVASGKLAEMGGSVITSESQAKVTEVPRSGTVAAGKRKVGRSPCGPVESRRVKVSPSSGGELDSSQSSSWVDKMKNKLLAWDMEAIAEGSAELDADEVCRSLLKVMFSFSNVETKLAETVEESSKDHEAYVYMRERYEVERKRGEDQLAAIDARDKEIKDLKDSIAGYEQAKEELQKRVADLIREDELKDDEVKSLKRKNELLQAKYDFFLGGSAVITRWETVKEYLAGQHLSWDLEGLNRRYAQMVKAHAQFKGRPAPEMVELLMALNDAPPS